MAMHIEIAVDLRRDSTETLIRSVSGDEPAAGHLTELVYGELKRLAASLMRRERQDHTLQPTAVVHEAYLRLIDQTQVDWKGKTHFLAVAAGMMRRVLIDHARERGAAKRGGGAERVSLEDAEKALSAESAVDVMDLESALEELSERDKRQARVAVLRFFGGLSVKEVAHVSGMSERSVKEDWRFARAWLRRRLNC